MKRTLRILAVWMINLASQAHAWDFLQEGDGIEVFHPGSRPVVKHPHTIDHLSEYLKESAIRAPYGLDLSFNKSTLDSSQTLGSMGANTAQERAQVFKKFMADPNAKALWANRGGYGASDLVDILEHVDPNFEFQPKPIIGFSDVTTLHLWAAKQRIPSLHGPVANFSEETYDFELTDGAVNQKTSHSQVWNCLKGMVKEVEYTLTLLNPDAVDPNRMRDEVDTSILVGNFSVVQRSNGSNTQLNGSNAVVFFEDTSEQWSRFNSLLTSMVRTGALDHSKALFFGDFDVTGDVTLEEVVRRFEIDKFRDTRGRRLPIFKGTGFGHGPINQVLPLGTKAVYTFDQAGNVTIKASVNQSAYEPGGALAEQK